MNTGDLQAAITRIQTGIEPVGAELNVLDAIITYLKEGDSPAGQLAQAEQEALVKMRDKPNKIGRARIFGDRTTGMDDPGMVAIKRLLTLMLAS